MDIIYAEVRARIIDYTLDDNTGQLLSGSIVRLELHRREPSLELLLANVAMEHLHAPLPQYLFVLFHVYYIM